MARFSYLLIFLAIFTSSTARAHESDGWLNRGDLLATVTGTVLNDRGAPVPGAKVYFKDPHRLFDRDFSPVAVANAAGRFILRCPQPEVYQYPLVAESPDDKLMGVRSFLLDWDGVPVRHPRQAPPPGSFRDPVTGILYTNEPVFEKTVRNIRIEMRRVKRIAGRVINEANEPVAGAYVGVRTGYPGLPEFDGAMTDADGRFSMRIIANIVPGTVFAIHPREGGYVSSDETFPNPETKKMEYTDPVMNLIRQSLYRPDNVDGLQIRLTRYATQVRLIDGTTRQPRTDMWVKPRNNKGNNSPMVSFPVMSDQDGVARFPWMSPPDRWQVYDARSLFGQTTDNTAGESAEVPVNFTVRKIYGNVTFPDGAPAAGISFGPEIQDSYLEKETRGQRSVLWTDSRGRYEIFVATGTRHDGPLPPLALTPQVPGFRNMKVAHEETFDDGKIVRRDIQLVASNVIRGRLTLDHPEKGIIPYPDVKLHLRRDLGFQGSRTKIQPLEAYTQTTDENGEYRFEVSHGYFTLSTENTNIHFRLWLDDEIHFPAPGPMEIVRNATAIWQKVGVLVRHNDKPLAGAEVGVVAPDGTLDVHAITDEDGQATLKYLTQQDEAFFARDTAKGVLGVRARDKDSDNAVIVVAPPGEVFGELFYQGTYAPKDANMEYLLQPMGVKWVELPLPTIQGATDGKGRFHATGLIPGVTYEVRYRPKRGTPDGPYLFSYVTRAGEVKAGDGSKKVPKTVAHRTSSSTLEAGMVYFLRVPPPHGKRQFAQVCQTAADSGRNVLLMMNFTAGDSSEEQLALRRALGYSKELAEDVKPLQLVNVTVPPQSADSAARLFGIAPETILDPAIHIIDPKTQRILASATPADFIRTNGRSWRSVGEFLDLEKLRAFLKSQ